MPDVRGDMVSIREAAEIVGVSDQTLRRWDRHGLYLRPVGRTRSGHRVYRRSECEALASGWLVEANNNKGDE